MDGGSCWSGMFDDIYLNGASRRLLFVDQVRYSKGGMGVRMMKCCVVTSICTVLERTMPKVLLCRFAEARVRAMGRRSRCKVEDSCREHEGRKANGPLKDPLEWLLVGQSG